MAIRVRNFCQQQMPHRPGTYMVDLGIPYPTEEEDSPPPIDGSGEVTQDMLLFLSTLAPENVYGIVKIAQNGAKTIRLVAQVFYRVP